MSKPKYTLNRQYFDEINSHNKAYFLGFLLADGYNHETKGSVVVAQVRRNADILYALQSEIESNCPITVRTLNGYSEPVHTFYMHSRNLSKKLSELGVIQNKSHKADLPPVKEEYLNSLLLGYFDGDGSLSFYKTNCNLTFTGNELLICKIKSLLDSKFNKGGYLNARNKLSPNIVTLTYTGKRSCKTILDWLYEDSTLRMKRKFDKYQYLKQLIGKLDETKELRKATKAAKNTLKEKQTEQLREKREFLKCSIITDLKGGFSIRQLRIKYKRNSQYIRQIIKDFKIEYGSRKRMFAKDPKHII